MRRRIYLTEDSPVNNAPDAQSDFDYEDEYFSEASYFEADEDAEQVREGLFSTPARVVTLVFSALLLLVVGAAIMWVLNSGGTSTGSTNAPADTSGLDIAPRVGALAPDFELLDVHTNKPVKLSSLRGKPVFMNFWGTWCPPCRAEMPEMEKLYNKYKGQVEILGVSMGPRDDPTRVQVFVDAASYSWTFIHDPDYLVATDYQVQAIPSSYFIDKDGVIRAVQVGGMNFGQMENNLGKVR